VDTEAVRREAERLLGDLGYALALLSGNAKAPEQKQAYR
jgi:hypothetical protein